MSKDFLQHNKKAQSSSYFLEMERNTQPLFSIKSKIPIYHKNYLSLVYTPGVGQCCLEISQDLT